MSDTTQAYMMRGVIEKALQACGALNTAAKKKYFIDFMVQLCASSYLAGLLSGAGSDERQRTAMNSLDKYLVKRDLKIIQLLDPPFDVNGPNTGYIRGYVPGVRENGGQYSHAAIWALMAFAVLKDREKVWELFSMIQPLHHASDENSMQVYKVEPYVMAADVYANESHKGRGGWTWYTGSAGWMYQFIISSLIGIELKKLFLSKFGFSRVSTLLSFFFFFLHTLSFSLFLYMYISTSQPAKFPFLPRFYTTTYQLDDGV